MAFIPVESMGSQKSSVFVLKSHLGMMGFLFGNVCAHRVCHGFADREQAITCLPMELGQQRHPGSLLREPNRGSAFHLLHPLGWGEGAAQSHQDMHMIGHSANHQRWGRQSCRNAAKITVQFISHRFVREEGESILRRPNGVNQHVSERLGHGFILNYLDDVVKPRHHPQRHFNMEASHPEPDGTPVGFAAGPGRGSSMSQASARCARHPWAARRKPGGLG